MLLNYLVVATQKRIAAMVEEERENSEKESSPPPSLSQLRRTRNTSGWLASASSATCSGQVSTVCVTPPWPRKKPRLSLQQELDTFSNNASMEEEGDEDPTFDTGSGGQEDQEEEVEGEVERDEEMEEPGPGVGLSKGQKSVVMVDQEVSDSDILRQSTDGAIAGGNRS